MGAARATEINGGTTTVQQPHETAMSSRPTNEYVLVGVCYYIALLSQP